MLTSNCADSRHAFRTEPLATSSVDVHGELMIDRLNVGYDQPTSESGRSPDHPLSVGPHTVDDREAIQTYRMSGRLRSLRETSAVVEQIGLVA
jgi:hypothetical protein